MKVLETVGDDSCTAMSMLLLLLNCTLKMVGGKFHVVCILPQSKKKGRWKKEGVGRGRREGRERRSK